MSMMNTERAERAVIVGITTREHHREQVEEYLDELQLLAESAGAVAVDRILQDRDNIDAAFFIGKGKAEELASIVEERKIDLVIFDDDLSAVQVRNLERLIKCKIVDRSGIILDIFASRAKTSEAKAQVELAQLQYMLPRLTRQWTHLSKQFGGIGTKGPGETQIETDRRAIRAKISRLNTRLNKISREREVQRKGRENFPRVALVGYTNVGKSTLLNWFTRAGVLVEDRLFEYMDRLLTCLGVYVIVAWRTLYVCRLGRSCPEMDCEAIFEPAEWKSVWKVVYREDPPAKPPTLGVFVRLVARLGGYIDRKRTEPGPQTLWIGLQRMHDFATCWQLFGPDAKNETLTCV